MILEVRGIVLSQQDYKEKDVLLRIATKEYGQLTLIAKSLRAMASKNAGSCMPFMESNFMMDYQENKTMHVLTGAQMVNAHRHLREDLYKQAFASCMGECMGYLMQLENDENQYEELQLALLAMEETTSNQASMLCFSVFLARLCHAFGIEPYVDGCVSCGNEQGICSVSIDDGGFVCADCLTPSQQRYPKEFLYLFRVLMKANYEHLVKIPTNPKTTIENILFLFDFIKEHTSFTSVSEKFIRDILHL